MKNIFFAFLTGLAVLSAFILWNSKPEYEPKTYEKELIVGAEKPNEDWCLRNTITGQEGEATIEEQKGGKYEYQLIATSRGIEVWVPCE